MLNLRQAAGSRGESGDPLPTVWNKWELAQIRPRKGQMTLLAGAPNAGKSLIALLYAIRVNRPVLYFSADTDQHDTIVRALAHLTGQDMDTVEEGLDIAEDYYLDHLDKLSHISFVFDPSPSIEDIDMELQAYVEVWGQEPDLVVIDNAMNVQNDDGDEFRGLRLVMKDLHAIARNSGAGLLVLHHTTGEFEGTENPPPRRAIHGKISHFPELILTMAKNGDFIGFACVKNRSGRADPQAKEAIWLTADYPRMQLSEGPIH